LVLSDWVSQHVARGVGGYEFLTEFVQWAAIIVSNGYDVALSSAHTRYLFVKHDRLAIAD
jgi:hypothetical protein